MFHRTPPKSKTTARASSVIFLLRDGHGGARRFFPFLVGRERYPAALSQALLVELAALLARRAIALELVDGVLGVGLVPLLLARPARGEQAGDGEAQEEHSHHARHHTTRLPRRQVPCDPPRRPAARMLSTSASGRARSGLVACALMRLRLAEVR